MIFDEFPTNFIFFSQFLLSLDNHTGVQFASMLIKAFAVDVLAEFHIDKCMHTQDPMVLKASTHPHILDAEKGFHIDLRRRSPEPAPYKSQIFS